MYKKSIISMVSVSAVAMSLMLAGCRSSSATETTVSAKATPTQGKLNKPLKVYLLAGQSNMQGKAQDFTLARMAMSPESKDLYNKLVDETGAPRVHKNVSAVYQTYGDTKRGKYREVEETKGYLSTGFGNNLGPELGFGVTIDAALGPSTGLRTGEPILIIKTAWGGKSLVRDFRSPSAGFEPDGKTAKYYLKKKKGEALEKGLDEMRTKGAPFYKLMMERFNSILADPSKYCDAYNPEHGYELSGFVWFQGYNDLPQPEGYSELMAHFIRDVRKDLKTPEMPFVIGVIGVGGDRDPGEKMIALRQEQAAVAEIPEFKGNVAAVPTAPFWDNEMADALERASKAEAMMEETNEWVSIGQPVPSERIWHYTTFSTADPKNGTHRKMKGVVGGLTLIEPPGALKNWLDPTFDTSSWKQGPAPVGKIEGAPKRKSELEALEKSIRSPWGDGNMLLMKTTFTNTEELKYLRLWVNATASYVAYLNGTLISNYPWWKNYKRSLRLRSTLIDGALLKKGKNEIAIYANFRRKGSFNVGLLDAYLVGMSKSAADKIEAEQASFFTPRDRELVKGKSNQAYHYLGSAYTYSRIGEAMAKAILKLQDTKEVR